MVRWCHIIMSAYGFWLPNDPRGSWSEFVGSWELHKFGRATTTTETRSLARNRHDVTQRRAAKRELKYPAVRFDESQRRYIGQGFAQAVAESSYVIPACCVGYDHVHMIIHRDDRTVERAGTHLKSRATMSLTRNGAHPLGQYRNQRKEIPTPWSMGMWKVFINDDDQLHTAIRYVQRHSAKEGLAPQRWSFVSKVPV